MYNILDIYRIYMSLYSNNISFFSSYSNSSLFSCISHGFLNLCLASGFETLIWNNCIWDLLDTWRQFISNYANSDGIFDNLKE